MRAAWYERNGTARDVLQTGEMPDPHPDAGEVRVRIQASGVNPSDWKTRSGSRPMAGPRVIPHSDGAGVIDSVGKGVAEERVGERVWVWNAQWKRPFGTAAEYVALPSEQAVRLPEAVSFQEGACLGIPALTAYRAVTVDGSVEGQRVLVTGGAGAVGQYAIQMAKLRGAAAVFGTVSSAEKADVAVAAGADAVVNYRTESVADRVAALTGGQGVDRIVEVDIAGNAPMLPPLLARDGLCVAYGSNTPEIKLQFGPMILSGAAIRFFIVYELPSAARREAIAELTRWLEEGRLRHSIGAEYSLDEIVQAHEAVERGVVIGNVIVRP